MATVQLIQISAEQLQNAIVDGVKTQLDDLKKHFTTKEPTIYLTRSEVAEMLSVDLSTLWNWTNQNKLVSYSIGKRIYYKRKEVEAAIVKLDK